MHFLDTNTTAINIQWGTQILENIWAVQDESAFNPPLAVLKTLKLNCQGMLCDAKCGEYNFCTVALRCSPGGFLFEH